MKIYTIFNTFILACVLGTMTMGAQDSKSKLSNVATQREQAIRNQASLVPLPQKLHWNNGHVLLNAVAINYPTDTNDKEQMKFILNELSQLLKSNHVKISTQASYSIDFIISSPCAPNEASAEIQNESYSLEIGKNKTSISAPTTKGFYYALQTLTQLISNQKEKASLPLCTIQDWPDLEIRGFMNDVGRNFMSVPLLKEEIDSLALLKFNVFHFHFTENEAWRLESKIYPQLTEAKNHTRHPGKFYTQKDFIDLANYCRLRNIQLIPEMDMPGHCGGLRRALGLDKMEDPKTTEALVNLITEMCSLVPAEKMPYIHIGTDEARGKNEHVSNDTLAVYFDTVEKLGRKPIRWQPGLNPKDYKGAIQQIWTERLLKNSWPSKGATYIDSHETYLNHIDPQQVAQNMYFRRPCPYPDAKGLGFILCSWPDLPIVEERGQVLQTPVYAGMAFCSEPLWNNPHPKFEGDPMKDELLPYFACLPPQDSPLLKQFAEYENRVLSIRDRFFKNKEFNYVKQSHIPWKIIGPFPNNGNVDQAFSPEEILTSKIVKDSYEHEGQTYTWHPDTYTGATVIFKHYCNMPTLFNGKKPNAYPHPEHTYYALSYIYSPKNQTVPFWVSGHTWATSDWRNGPASVPNKWFHANPKFFVNGKEITAPTWAKNNNNQHLIDENYQFREPTMIKLNQGWNQILVKSPNNKSTRRWMFTFTPVLVNPKTPGMNVKEFPGLKFSTNPKNH